MMSTVEQKEVKEPLIRMMKRDSIPARTAWLIRITAVILALIVCAFAIVAITKLDPFQVYVGIIDGAIGNSRRTWVTIRDILVLLGIAIALDTSF